MKYIFILLITTLSCAAQEIHVEEMPAVDVLKYLNIDPNSVAFWKLKVTFPNTRFGALEFREITSGKENLKMHEGSLKGQPKGVGPLLATFDAKKRINSVSSIDQQNHRFVTQAKLLAN